MSSGIQEVCNRRRAGEIAMTVSNHQDAESLSFLLQIPFHHFSTNKVNKTEVKKSEIDLLERSHIDSIVLAHLYADLVTQVCGTFGAKPYHAAFEREVKLIGATSHYVTEDPDEGPIIRQDVTRVSHRDQVADLVQRGGIWSG